MNFKPTKSDLLFVVLGFALIMIGLWISGGNLAWVRDLW